jgi:hypothetical protein
VFNWIDTPWIDPPVETPADEEAKEEGTAAAADKDSAAVHQIFPSNRCTFRL